MSTHRSSTTQTPWDRAFSVLARVFVWGSLFGALYLLRSFFLLIFLTFVFAYIQSHMVERLGRYISNRPVRTVVVGTAFLLILISLGRFIVPHVKEQTEVFASRYTGYLQKVDHELMRLTTSYPAIGEIVPGFKDLNGSTHGGEEQEHVWSIKESPSAALFQTFLGFGNSASSTADVHDALKTLKNVGGQLIATGSAFFLSLLFSFLIVLDLPRLTQGIQTLAHTKVRFIYFEMKDNIYNFCRIVGRALEAQLFIAILNTVLTAIGIYIIGIRENLTFISVVVFLGSFIPVAGVFISSIPICLIALQQDGVTMMLLTALLIWIIHMIEAYVLNPKIYGHHLRINPVLVLIILTIGGKLFNVWGLVLGLPVCTYIFTYAIRERPAVQRS